jgi:glutamate-5-semialdehyde dehydrogenase
MIDTQVNLADVGLRARAAARLLARATTAQKNAALLAIADALEQRAPYILEHNALDLADGQANGLSAALLDRISLQTRLGAIAADVRRVAQLPDPVGHEYDKRALDGLQVCRRRTPIGVIGVIYEARPNVTVDVAVLTLKSANAVILRGGKEIGRSNAALLQVMREALARVDGIPSDAFQAITDPDRAHINTLLKMHDTIDMIIPRGGNALHKLCRENSTIPVITGGVGICHIFVDESADLDKAMPVIENAKTQRPSVCNTLDTLLVHHSVAAQFLPRVVQHLAAKGVTFRAEPRALALVQDQPTVQAAGPEDFDTEWMALVLGLKVVDTLDEALDHISAHSLNHSDSILTRDAHNAARFLNEVDSSAVFWNASTRFNDGGALGLGAEVAVSTQKLHARGPMALEELTTYKWVVVGDGHWRTS